MVRILSVLLLAAVAWGVYGNVRVAQLRADVAECQRTHAEALAITLRAAQQADADYRAREAHITRTQQEALNAAHAETLVARADRDRVRAALERLLHQQAAAARGGSPTPDTAVAGASAPAGAAADLPSDLLWRLGQAAGELAAAADDARTAGRACERAYDAVTTASPRLGVQQ